ncbi:hypothetical protein DMN91_005689 [Ooceraea biroi]|uniref:Mos1 transposase HTH domain-containing protein n=1 Tax=Ooceraea biroi TaxID=2015173 RepID=A0A3L8DLW5_OOCBI|nr:hypothetical protein DMN91_005689 [Ooceraea biroi]
MKQTDFVKSFASMVPYAQVVTQIDKLVVTLMSETARNINAVFGEGSTTKATVGNWFKNFRDGDFSLANEPRGRPKTKVDNDHLRAVVESDPSQSTRELASIFNVSILTILFI